MITALGLGTKQAPENVNLDPQRQFWSWLRAFLHPDENGDNNAHQRAYFSGFSIRQNDPAGMSILIGGTNTPDSAVLVVAPVGKPVLLSTDGTPEVVNIPTAPTSGSRIDTVVTYIDTTSPDAEAETPGTPEYVKTIVVSGTAASSPSAPTHQQIIAALPAGAGGTYYRWCDVKVAANQTTITNSNITDRKPASPNAYSATIWNGHGGLSLTNNDKRELEQVVLPAGDWLVLTSCRIQVSGNTAGVTVRVDTKPASASAIAYGGAYLSNYSHGMVYAIGLCTSDGVTPIAVSYQKSGSGTIAIDQRRNMAMRVTQLTSLNW